MSPFSTKFDRVRSTNHSPILATTTILIIETITPLRRAVKQHQHNNHVTKWGMSSMVRFYYGQNLREGKREGIHRTVAIHTTVY